jgi:hypothetical protein
MTEEEWLTSAGVAEMLEFIRESDPRRLRLFSVACCYLARSRSKDAAGPDVECVVRWVDGADNLEEVRTGWRASTWASEHLCYPERPMDWCVAFVNCAPDRNPLDDDQFKGFPTTIELSSFIRDIFGNPFRPVTFSPEWRTSTAVAIAQQMYELRDFSAMPILADALQDAGCDSDDVLNHCRDEKSTHARGCWVVDLVLGKV